MRLGVPWALLGLLPALGLVGLIARHGRSPVSRRQENWAHRVRLASVALLVLALAQPALVLPSSEQSVVFLIDSSDSVGPAGISTGADFVSEAVESSPADARWSVVMFGSETRVDRSLAPGDRFPEIGTEVDGSATDLAGAMESVAALMPTDGSRRVVIVSDLVPTNADTRNAARVLAESGVALDVVSVPTGRGDDVLVESVRMPATARQGDLVTATVEIRSTRAGAAVLRIDQGAITLPVQLVEGTNTIDVEVAAEGSGFLPVTAEIEADFDTRPENDTASGITRVLGPARVALVEAIDGEGDELSRALAAGGIQVDVLGSVPSATGLLRYDSVILVNVPQPETEAAEALASFVEDLGRGLVVVGGDQAFGLGDYDDTPLEAILPVSSNPDDLLRRQPVAQVLVIDTSGSMAACHCGPGNEAMPSGGVNKTDISRAGAALAIDAMASSDRVGVLAFSSGYDWVLPLAAKPEQALVETALAGLTPEGDTEINAALEAALDELTTAPESLKHIVLFTDGWDPTDADLVPTARRIADEGVTLSVLGTGEGPGHTLERMAEIGGGRYYAGNDLAAIPEIFVEETLTVSRNLATEGSFLPTVIGRSDVTADLVSSPPLLGYVLTKAKGTSQVLLEIDRGDPLLATWQRGLGRVTAWTSDATTRWSAGWVDWEGYVGFWGAVVRDVLPSGRDTPPEVWVDGGEVRVRVSDPALTDETAATARIRRPDGSIESVVLDRVSASVLEADVAGSGPGAYWVAVTLEEGSGGQRTISSGAVSSYQPEFAFREPDPTLADDLAATSGGRVDPASAEVWDPAPVRGRSVRPISMWLLAIALAGFSADVVLRRLSLSGAAPTETRIGPASPGSVEATGEVEPHAEVRAPTASDSETLQRLMRRRQR